MSLDLFSPFCWPVWGGIFTKRIAELTEDLEELRSEKAVLLQRMHFPEDATADSFKKEIRTLEDGLKKLEASETKYAVELDNALKEYAELQEQASDFDPVELHKVRQANADEKSLMVLICSASVNRLHLTSLKSSSPSRSFCPISKSK